MAFYMPCIASGIPGGILLGHLSDKHDLRVVMMVSTLGSSLAVFLLWGLASGLPPLIAFALIYGFLAPPYVPAKVDVCAVTHLAFLVFLLSGQSFVL